MAFCFKKKESVRKAIRRLASERIENAIECVNHFKETEAIHRGRKNIKKVRAVLRLVHNQIGTKEFRSLAKLLREAAEPLGRVRDSHVQVKTWIALKNRLQQPLGRQGFQQIRVALGERVHEEMSQFKEENRKKEIKTQLRCIAKRLKRLDLQAKGWRALGPGMKASYARGLCCYQVARQSRSPEHLHNWRKRAKELLYQIRLLRPIWPEQIDAIASDLEKLEEQLGNDHDLVMLQETIQRGCAGDAGIQALDRLSKLIEERQSELRSAALTLGARFYAEKPSTFCKRLAGYWKIWRREKPHPRGSTKPSNGKSVTLRTKPAPHPSLAEE